MSSDIVISLNGVSKRFEMYSQPKDRLLQFLSFGRHQYFKEFWALKDISFEVAKGETVGILGRNGSGKSTLLQIIAGTLAPTVGEVQTHGVLAALLELGSGFNSEFSGRENVYVNGAILGYTREQMDERFDAIAAFADIGEHLEQPVKTYSSGMYVRLAFAVQACIEPQILIVDEALSVGDEKFQRKCFDYIERLRANGCAVLLVTHSTATVEKFCQRGVLLHKGEKHGIGPAKSVVDQYHALLYSDEKAYLRYLNSQPVGAGASLVCNEIVLDCREGSETSLRTLLADHVEKKECTQATLKALIARWEVVSDDQNPSEAFRTGEVATVSFEVEVFSPVDELQAGILIRTVEGVSAFGTSTLYHDYNYLSAKPGDTVKFSFTLRLDLCPGTYFVTLAVAEAMSHEDMLYLDRKTDVIVLSIGQLRTTSTGIAALATRVDVVLKGFQ